MNNAYQLGSKVNACNKGNKSKGDTNNKGNTGNKGIKSANIFL